MNTGFYQFGSVVVKRSLVLKNYIMKVAYIDLIAMYSLAQYLSNENDNYLIFYLIRTSSFSQLFKYFDTMFQLETRYPIFYELSQLCFTIIFVAHYCACAFYFIAQLQIEQGETDTWIQSAGQDQQEWNVIYIEALYFAFITMSTVGYGDISPNTYVEKCAGIFITIISCGVYAFALNTMGQIIRDKQIRNSSLNQKKYEVIKYMRKRNISKRLQLQVVKEVEYIEKQEQNGNTKGRDIIKIINQNVQDNIFQEYYGSVLRNSKFAKIGFYSQLFLDELAPQMSELTLRPGTILFKQGESDDRYIIVLDGQLQVFFENKNNQGLFSDRQLITTLKGQQEISHRSFYTGFECQYTVSSSTVCRIVYFKRSDLLCMLQKYPEDYERFCLAKDRFLFNKNQLVEKCFTCKSYVHQTIDCPFVHQQFVQHQIIYKSNKIIENKRKQFVRKQKNEDNNNTFAFLYVVRQELMRFRTDTITEFSQIVVSYDITDYDIDFYLEMPKIMFSDDNEIYISEHFSPEEEIILQQYINEEYDQDINYIEAQQNINQKNEMNQISEEDQNSCYSSSLSCQQEDSIVATNIYQVKNAGRGNENISNKSDNRKTSFLVQNSPQKKTKKTSQNQSLKYLEDPNNQDIQTSQEERRLSRISNQDLGESQKVNRKDQFFGNNNKKTNQIQRNQQMKNSLVGLDQNLIQQLIQFTINQQQQQTQNQNQINYTQQKNNQKNDGQNQQNVLNLIQQMHEKKERKKMEQSQASQNPKSYQTLSSLIKSRPTTQARQSLAVPQNNGVLRQASPSQGKGLEDNPFEKQVTGQILHCITGSNNVTKTKTIKYEPFNIIELDKMKILQVYMPEFNYGNIIKYLQLQHQYFMDINQHKFNSVKRLQRKKTMSNIHHGTHMEFKIGRKSNESKIQSQKLQNLLNYDKKM